jgi:hypothetical protein
MSDADPLLEALGDSLAYSADDHSAVMWVESSVENHFPQANRDMEAGERVTCLPDGAHITFRDRSRIGLPTLEFTIETRSLQVEDQGMTS